MGQRTLAHAPCSERGRRDCGRCARLDVGQPGFVETLWVREDLRRAGLGARLLATAEVEAVRRGCREMHLDTHSYQAPDFYHHRGYAVIGELPGWPDQTTRGKE